MYLGYLVSLGLLKSVLKINKNNLGKRHELIVIVIIIIIIIIGIYIIIFPCSFKRVVRHLKYPARVVSTF